MPLLVIFLFIALVIFPSAGHAYIGPGMGLGVVGTIIGVLFSIVIGLIGIFWYPIKRLLAKTQK